MDDTAVEAYRDALFLVLAVNSLIAQKEFVVTVLLLCMRVKHSSNHQEADTREIILFAVNAINAVANGQ